MENETVAIMSIFENTIESELLNDGYTSAYRPFKLAKINLSELEADMEIKKIKDKRIPFHCYYYKVPVKILKGEVSSEEKAFFWLRASPYKEVIG